MSNNKTKRWQPPTIAVRDGGRRLKQLWKKLEAVAKLYEHDEIGIVVQ